MQKEEGQKKKEEEKEGGNRKEGIQAKNQRILNIAKQID